MSLIDWKKALPDVPIVVRYSSLEVNDVRDRFDTSVAELEFPGGYFIDVSWLPDEQEYSIRLYRDFFEKDILVRQRKTVQEVIEEVVLMADYPRSETTRLSYDMTSRSGSRDPEVDQYADSSFLGTLKINDG